MDIGVLRDLVVIIGGFLFLIMIILAVIFGWLLYRDIKSLISSAKNTINAAKQIGSDVKQGVDSFKKTIDIFKEKKTEAENKPSEDKLHT